MMKLLLTLLGVCSVLTFSRPVLACHLGDRRMGPNCIHVEESEPCMGLTEGTWSEVYRIIDHEDVFVWAGSGKVVFSTPKILRVHDRRVFWTGAPPVRKVIDHTFTVRWDGSRYVEAGK